MTSLNKLIIFYSLTLCMYSQVFACNTVKSYKLVNFENELFFYQSDSESRGKVLELSIDEDTVIEVKKISIYNILGQEVRTLNLTKTNDLDKIEFNSTYCSIMNHLLRDVDFGKEKYRSLPKGIYLFVFHKSADGENADARTFRLIIE